MENYKLSNGANIEFAAKEGGRIERVPRRDVRIKVTRLSNRTLQTKLILDQDEREYPCWVIDASDNGLQISTDLPLEKGMTFRLKMGIARPQRVILRWVDGNKYGVEFV